MGAGASGAVGGAIVGLSFIFLLQQLGFLDLSQLVPGLELLFLGTLVGALVLGSVGRLIGARGPTTQRTKPHSGSGATSTGSSDSANGSPQDGSADGPAESDREPER
ncbi:MAG: hypothetical protein ACHQ2Y_05465 [Candidatus Lutacidiplasmatales archaeon]